jgi:hypothetical protein
MGAMEATIVKTCARSKRELPEKVRNAPTLEQGLELYYIAFQRLSSTRAVGMGLGPIPWTAIQTYCETYELDEVTQELMHVYIPAMDNVFLKISQEKKS